MEINESRSNRLSEECMGVTSYITGQIEEGEKEDGGALRVLDEEDKEIT